MTVSAARVPLAVIALMVASLTGLAVMSQFFRSMVAVIAPTLIEQLGLSGKQIGAVSGTFFIAMALLQLPVGLLLDRFGPRRTIIGMQAFGIAGTVLFATAASAAGLTAGMFLIGLGCAPVIIGSIVLMSRWLPPDRFTMGFTGITAISGLGGLLSSAPLAWAAEAVGWRLAVGGCAALVVVFAAGALVFIRDAPPGHPSLTRAPESPAAMLAGLWEVLTTRDIWTVLCIPFVGYATIITIRGLWGGPYLADVHGMDLSGGGELLLVMALAMVVGAAVYGPLDRMFDTRKGVILPGGVVTVGLLVVLALWPGMPVWGAMALFAGIGLIGAYYLLGMAHLKAFFPDRLVGRAVTTLNLATFAGVAAMQLATGAVVDAVTALAGAATPPEAAYRAVFGFQAVACALALLVYARSRDIPPSAEAAARAETADGRGAGAS